MRKSDRNMDWSRKGNRNRKRRRIKNRDTK